MSCTILPKLRQLLPHSPSQDRGWVLKTKARLKKLLQAQPQQISGRQIFFKEMVRKSEAVNRKSDRRAFTSEFIMQRHGARWNELRPQAKAQHEQRAQFARAVKLKQVEEAIEQEEATLSVARLESTEGKLLGAMLASSCRLEGLALNRMQQLWDSPLFTKHVVQNNQRAALTCPEPVPDDRFAALQGKSALPQRVHQEIIALGRRVAQCRKELSNSVIAICDEGCWSWFKFSLAMLQPTTLVMIPLQELELGVIESPPKTIREWSEQQGQEFSQSWKYTLGDVELQDPFVDVAEDACHLVRHTVHQGPGILTSNCPLEPLGAFLKTCDGERPVKAKARHTSAPSQPPPAKKRAVGQLPAWMTAAHGTGLGSDSVVPEPVSGSGAGSSSSNAPSSKF